MRMEAVKPQAPSDSADFFMCALREAGCADQAQGLQERLYALLAKEALLFAKGDSSLTVEAAEAVLRSLCFTIGLYLKPYGLNASTELLKSVPFEELLRRGRDAIRVHVTTARERYAALMALPFQTHNRAFCDTVSTALPAFFKRYDALQAAHEIPCLIDYPLSSPVTGLSGIEYISEFLFRLLMETRFLCAFPKSVLESLWRSCCVDPKEQIVNLFEPVFYNAVGRLFLEKDPLPLDLPIAAQQTLMERLKRLPSKVRSDAFHEAATALCQKLFPGAKDAELPSFLHAACEELCKRLEARPDLPGPFTAFPAEGRAKPEVFLKQNPPMPDEALRALIEEMQTCRFLSDKLLMLDREVSSVADWLEVVPLCFSMEEYPSVFSRMKPQELAIVARIIPHDSDRPLAQWEEAFFHYLQTLSKAAPL
jgi:hypothetical protein